MCRSRAGSLQPPRDVWRLARVGRRGAALALCALWLCAVPAAAVVIVTGDGSGNTTAPSDDPGFAHVGVTGNSLTGIYLGYGWFLTANHVGETSIRLGGITYPAVPGSKVQLVHTPAVPPNPPVYADLALVRIVGEPPLAPLVLSSATPSIGNLVTMIGNGFDRQTTQTCWDASFVERSCSGPPPAYRGYEPLGSQRTIRWGRNDVFAVGIDVPIWPTTTRSFQVDFDQSGISHEAQAVPGDSGGAVFLKRGSPSQWELVGVMFATLVYTNQPADTAVFGDGTLSVDVAHYHAQIQSIITAPLIPALPWPTLALGALLLAAAARRTLSR